MKKQAKLAFDMLEQEMGSIAFEEQRIYRGGAGGSGYSGSGFWMASGSGMWNTSGYYGGGSYSTGSYGSGYGSGSYGSGSYGSGTGPEDPWQIINGYVSSQGGWDSWSGGYIPGYGYMGATTTISPGGSSGTESSLMYQVENTVSNIFNSAGMSASATSVLRENIAGRQLTSFSFKQVGTMLTFVGTAATGADIVFNIQEILTEDQTSVQILEDYGQIALNVVGLATEEVGIGFGINCILAVWEMDEATNGR